MHSKVLFFLVVILHMTYFLMVHTYTYNKHTHTRCELSSFLFSLHIAYIGELKKDALRKHDIDIICNKTYSS